MKTRYIILIICYLPSFHLWAQKKCSINIEILPNYSVYNSGSPIKMAISPGIEAGFKYYYKPAEHYSFYAGIMFTRYNYLTKKTTAIYTDTAGAPKEQGYTLTHFRAKWNLTLLSLPLGMQYHIGRRFALGFGPTVMYLLGSKAYSILYYGGNAVRKTTDGRSDKEFFRSWMLNGHLEAAYTMKLFKSDISWKAAFDYGITNYFVQGPGKLHPYTFSLGASVPLWRWGK